VVRQAKTHLVSAPSDDVLRRLEKNLFPYIGKRSIDEIEAFELLTAVRKIEDRGARDLAHRVLGVAGQVFRYGILPPQRCTRDLSADLRGALAPHKKKHQAAVKPDELPNLMRVIATYDQEVGDRQTRLALELLALTFVRTNELIGAEWPEIDLDSGVWIVPAERMKMKAERRSSVACGARNARAFQYSDDRMLCALGAGEPQGRCARVGSDVTIWSRWGF
jgi:integrase